MLVLLSIMFPIYLLRSILSFIMVFKSGFMVGKSCLKVISVSPTYDFEVRSAGVLPSQLGSLASVYGLFHVWHAAAYDTILFLLNSVLSVFFLNFSIDYFTESS